MMYITYDILYHFLGYIPRVRVHKLDTALCKKMSTRVVAQLHLWLNAAQGAAARKRKQRESFVITS